MMKTSRQDVINQEQILTEVQAAYDAVIAAQQVYKQNNHTSQLPQYLTDAEQNLLLQLTRENAKMIRLRNTEDHPTKKV